MTFGFALVLAGFVLLDAGWKGTTPAGVLRGATAGSHGAGGVLAETGKDVMASFSGSSKSSGAEAEPKGKKKTGGVRGGKTKEVPQTHAAATALKGVGTLDGHPVAAWIIPFLLYARAHGWKGRVESGYRTDQEQTEIYNSGVRPAAVPKSLGGSGSNHEGKVFPEGAVDVTEAAQLSAILEKMPGGSLLKWAGSADPVHFSFPHNGGY